MFYNSSQGGWVSQIQHLRKGLDLQIFQVTFVLIFFLIWAGQAMIRRVQGKYLRLQKNIFELC